MLCILIESVLHEYAVVIMISRLMISGWRHDTRYMRCFERLYGHLFHSWQHLCNPSKLIDRHGELWNKLLPPAGCRDSTNSSRHDRANTSREIEKEASVGYYALASV